MGPLGQQPRFGGVFLLGPSKTASSIYGVTKAVVFFAWRVQPQTKAGPLGNRASHLESIACFVPVVAHSMSLPSRRIATVERTCKR
jgi:hypothetical protein